MCGFSLTGQDEHRNTEGEQIQPNDILGLKKRKKPTRKKLEANTRSVAISIWNIITFRINIVVPSKTLMTPENKENGTRGRNKLCSSLRTNCKGIPQELPAKPFIIYFLQLWSLLLIWPNKKHLARVETVKMEDGSVEGRRTLSIPSLQLRPSRWRGKISYGMNPAFWSNIWIFCLLELKV